MGYDPDQHHRRSQRSPHYDYTSAGAYFITICTHQHQCLFGTIIDGVMQLTEWGEVAQYCWQAIPDHFAHVQLDAFVVMPNHVHGIIVITDPAQSQFQKRQFRQPIAGSLPTSEAIFTKPTNPTAAPAQPPPKPTPKRELVAVWLGAGPHQW